MIDDLLEKLEYVAIDDVVNETAWLKAIDASGADVDEKVNMVIKAIECPQEYLDLFKNLVDLLAYLITEKQSKKYTVTVTSFGSSATNLALKMCDLDLFVKFDPAPNYDKKWFLNLRKIFFAYNGDLFTDMIFIDARVPILKCRHVIGVQCDISANNELALQNTKLIKFLISLNKRFRPFFLMIKLWIKRKNANIANNFKGYLVTLMTVFFLQQKNLLPSVKALQINCDKPLNLNGWNCYFNDDPSCFRHITSQNLVVTELLKDFFDFYSKFEFGFYVINPNCGEKILKSLRNDCEGIEDLWDQSKGYITVQDVFQLDFSTSAYISRKAIMDFQSSCQEVSAMWAENDLLFSSIFSKNAPAPKRKKKSNDLCLVVGYCGFEGNTEDELRTKWLTRMIATVEDLFRHVAFLDVTSKEDGFFIVRTTSPSIFNKKIRNKVRQDFEPVVETLESWPQTLNSLKPEAVTSTAIATSEKETSEPMELKITYSMKTQPTKIEFKIDTLKKNSDLNHLQTFQSISSYLSTWLSKL